jgi:hypothetical protein
MRDLIIFEEKSFVGILDPYLEGIGVLNDFE